MHKPKGAGMSTTQERASYPLKIQAIRSTGQNLRFYVYLPMPLAAALGIDGGEEVEWELLDRRELRLVRQPRVLLKAKRPFARARRK
jgi:hypothetical protein